MRERVTAGVAVATLVLASVFCQLSIISAEDDQPDNEIILRIAVQREPTTRNILAARDEWSQKILAPVYDTVAHLDPDTEELKPYILKGTDANGNGVFDDNEYGIFTGIPGSPLEVTAFYDFNSAYFHDGYQATVDDLLFSYHLDALNPENTPLDVLKDNHNLPGSNYSMTRWLHLNQLKGFNPIEDWLITNGDYTNPSYDTSLRAAVQFNQQAPYASFWRSTLTWRILPSYLWEGTGCVYEDYRKSFKCDIHRSPGGTLLGSFGIAYDPVTGNGVSSASPNAFDFWSAKSWEPSDEQVIGTGPFTWSEWVRGQSIRLNKNENYLTGVISKSAPHIDAMVFKPFTAGHYMITALKNGEIDYISWSILPSFLPELESDSNIDLVVNNEKGFTYLAFNLRREPFGYQGGDPGNGDIGLNFRRAVSHLIDSNTIVSSLLQGFAYLGNGPVHPKSEWHNSTLPVHGYDPDAADSLLDTYDEWDASDGPCERSGAGCRSFPQIGTNEIGISTPDAAHDPVRAAAGTMILQAMRDVGINVVSGFTTLNQIYAGDFDIFLYNWIIDEEPPPEFLFSFFYSRGSVGGLNYMGYQSDEFDQLILDAREELDTQEQIRLIGDAQGVLVSDRAVEALYYRQSIEAYRSDRFTNWTVGSWGSIYSYWSWLSVQKTPPDPLRITTSIQTAIKTDKTTKFTATVRDLDGGVIPDATVHVYVAPANGNFILGGLESNAVSGTTNLNGQFKVTYVPPSLNPSDEARTVIIYAKATHSDHPDSRNASTILFVHPMGSKFLTLLVDLPVGDLVEEGRVIPIRIQVRDQDDSLVSGANVTAVTDPFAEIEPNKGITDTRGYIAGVDHVIFEAPNVYRDEVFSITASADKAGYEATERSFTITVVDVRSVDEPPPEFPLVGLLLLGLVVVIVAIGLVMLMKKGRKEDSDGSGSGDGQKKP